MQRKPFWIILHFSLMNLCLPLGDGEHTGQAQRQTHLQSPFARDESESAAGLQTV